ncbi:MAG: RtcB family protein, partial [Methanosarcinales archaeon]
MTEIKELVNKISDNVWEVPIGERKGIKMRVPGRVFVSSKLLEDIELETIGQVANVATLPGIQKYSMAMPDAHYGYGFPIGGVAAFDREEGVISPGGVGYDINCLSGDTKILHEHGYTLPIRDFEKTWIKARIKYMNFTTGVKNTDILA